MGRKKDKGLFDFDKEEVYSAIRYDLKLNKKIKQAFDYTHSKLKDLGYHTDLSKKKKINLEKCPKSIGKNYNWMALSSGKDIKLILREYKTHHTIYIQSHFNDYFETIAFTFYTDMDKKEDEAWDTYCENPYTDLNKYIFEIVKQVEEIYFMSHIDVDDDIEVKVAYVNDTIRSVDKMLYCAEEISTIYMELYSENDILDMLKKLAEKDVVGDDFRRYKIASVDTDLKKDYYGVGLNVMDGEKEKFIDVYNLAYYYYEEFMELYKKHYD